MDDAAPLRQTIRRCTAALVATIAITGAVLAPRGDSGLLVLIALGAIVYLVNEFFQLIPEYEDTDDKSADSKSPEEPASDP